MGVMRPCYDKYWRCPGWAGSGWKQAKVKTCDGGSLASVINFEGRWRWQWHQCPTCKVWVMPHVARYLSPFWWIDKITWDIRKIVWDVRLWWYHKRKG